MSSSRLPGKVLADVEGEPMLELLLRRIAGAGDVVVATSDRADDDPVAALAVRLGAGVHRGSLEDVLGRIAGAVGKREGPVVRLTADCPLADPGVIRAVIALAGQVPGCRYASNVEPRTHPDGLDVEVLPAEALRELDRTVTDARDREHVTLAARRDATRFPRAVLPVGDPRLAELRWTIDEPEDLAWLRRLVGRLGERRHHAPVDEVLAAIRAAPDLCEGGVRG